MNVAKIIAGCFAGTGGLICIWKGIETGDPYVIGLGTTIISTMLSFFIGEANGKRLAGKEED